MGEMPQAVDTVVDKQVREAPSQLPRPTPAPEKNHRDDPAEVENTHHSEARRESPDNPKKGGNWQFIGVVVAAIGVVVAIIFGSLALRSSRENTEALRKIAEITAELVAENPTEAAETAKRVQQYPPASVIARARAAAIQLQQQGKIEKAIEKWRAIANVVEDRQLQAQAWFSVGYLHTVGDGVDREAAIKAYTEAIELSPTWAEAYNNRGNLKNELSQYQAALADLDRAIELKPTSANAYNNRGRTKSELGQPLAGLADLDRAIELKPTSAGFYNNRGNLKNELSQYQAALADLDRAIELDPTSADAYSNRGRTKNELSQYQAALADLDRAIELKPTFATAYNNRGASKIFLLRLNEAREDFQKALALAQEAGDENVMRLANHNLNSLDKIERRRLRSDPQA